MARNPVQFQKGISLNDSSRSTAPKTNASTPCINGAGRTVFYAHTAPMTGAAS